MKKSKQLLPIFILAVSGTVIGKELPKEIRSPQALGAGNASTTYVKAADAMLLNPANLASSNKTFNEIVIASPSVVISGNTFEIVAAAQSMAEGGGSTEGGESSEQLTQMLDFVDSLTGQPMHLSIQNFSGIVFKQVGAGIYTNAEINMYMGTDFEKGVTVVDADGLVRVGFITAFAREIFIDTLKAGLGIKVMQKHEGAINMSTVDLLTMATGSQTSGSGEEGSGTSMESLMDEAYKQGTGIGFDLGLLWEPEHKHNHKLGITIRNVLDLDYGWSLGPNNLRPTSEKRQIDIGWSVNPESEMSKIFLGFDIKDVLNSSESEIYRRIHIGGAIEFYELIGFTAGLNQGYLTYGGYANLKVVKLELGNYTEELGKYPGNRPSNRYYGRLSVGWVR